MPWQTDHPHIMAEILAAKLCADTHFARHFENFFFPFKVTESVAALTAACRQRIERSYRCHLDGLHRCFG